MTREEIIRMAQGAEWLGDAEGWTFDTFEQLERFVKSIEERAAAAEREECAKVCDTHEAQVPNGVLGAHPDYSEGKRMAFHQAAKSMRARGKP